MTNRPWSFSSLTLYEGCPQKYKLRYIDKIKEPDPEPDSPLVRGNLVHSKLEDFLLKDSELPEEASRIDEYCSAIKEADPIVEQDWGFTDTWGVTDWSSKDISCRMKLDAFVMKPPQCWIIDWKTGKDYPIKRISQGQLYAIGAAKRFPDLEKFHIEFAYVDQGFVKTTTYIRTQVDKFIKNYERRVTKLQNDTVFKAINNKWNCKYCPYGPFGINHCQYGVAE
jgi:CRISPR/Cas system-associated exonuclease Cas4 (RecB family)